MEPTPERVYAPVVRPAVPLVYLDLNHFINLARAARGLEQGAGYPDLLRAARSAAADGRVVFPLSSQHFIETTLVIKDPKQRAGVAQMMEYLSGFSYLLGRVDLFRMELEAGIAAQLNESQTDPHPLLGPSFGRAFGMVGGMKIVSEKGEPPEVLRDQMGAEKYDKLLQEMNVVAERMMLRGPTDEEAVLLREKHGWKPEESIASQESRVERERAIRDQLNSKPEGKNYRKNKLRDFISALEICHEWLDIYTEVKLARIKRGTPYEPTDAEGRRLFEGMPHLQVAISMKAHYHRNPQHNWTRNDIYDIDALAIAYAYCDVVFTDKAAANALRQAADIRDLNTYMPGDPTELATWLDGVPKRITGDLLVPASASVSWSTATS